MSTHEKDRHYVVNFVWQQYINYSTVIIALSCYLGYTSGAWQMWAILSLAILFALSVVMGLVRLRAEQLFRLKDDPSPTQTFP